MNRLIMGLIAGTVFIAAIVYWPVSNTFASGQSGPEGNIKSSSLADMNIGALNDVLGKVENEIQDEEILSYYKLLISSYGIEDTENSEDVLPDIDNIVKQATTLPLQEAGKTITDNEIKEFYYEFLSDAGWDIGE